MARLLDAGAVLDRVRRDLDRTALRTRNGLKYLAGVGLPELGCSPKELVWQRDKVCLYRYESDHRSLYPPVLLVHSLVSKPYVLDLRPGNSFVEAIVGRGFDVYAIDWGIPDAVEAENTFETYCDEYLPRAAQAVLDTSAADELTVYGYCFGGVLSLLFVAGHPELPVRNLALMATPLDFSELGAFNRVLRDGRLDVDELVDETGNIPPQIILDGLRSLKATSDLASYATLLNNLDRSEHVAAHQALMGWAHDHIPFPGACFRQTVDWFVRADKLVEGRVPLGGRDVDLGSIGCPVLNVVGDADHIVPVDANAPIRNVLPHADDVHFPSGHVGLIVGTSAHKRSIPGILDWLEAHSDRA